MDIMITPNKLESILEMPLADDIKTNQTSLTIRNMQNLVEKDFKQSNTSFCALILTTQSLLSTFYV